MSFKELQEAILTEARERAEHVSAQLAERTSAEEQRILSKARSMEENIVSEADAQGEKQARRIRQEAELSGRALVLNAKQEELEQTKADVVTKLLAQDASALLKSLLALVPDTKGTIIPGELHADALGKLVKGKAKLGDKTLKGEGGFIFQSSHSELNLTISHLVDRLFVKHRAEIAKALFS